MNGFLRRSRGRVYSANTDDARRDTSTTKKVLRALPSATKALNGSSASLLGDGLPDLDPLRYSRGEGEGVEDSFEEIDDTLRACACAWGRSIRCSRATRPR